MAFTTGTAANAADYYAKLITFLTTNADLVANDEEWTIAWTDPSGPQAGIVFRGPGLGGTESIYFGLELIQNVPTDQFWIRIYGMAGVIATAIEMRGHVNVSPSFARMYLDSNPFFYWFIANGRRFLSVAKITTVFEAMYAGLFLPYSSPLSYKYPLMIGGSTTDSIESSGEDSWRSTSATHQNFPFAYQYNIGASLNYQGACQFLSPAGEWLKACGSVYGNPGDYDAVIYPNLPVTCFVDVPNGSYNPDASERAGQSRVHNLMVGAEDGTITLNHLQFIRFEGQEAVYGVFDGCYRVGGFGQGAENTVTIDEVDYLIVQNAYRTDVQDYWAVRLE